MLSTPLDRTILVLGADARRYVESKQTVTSDPSWSTLAFLLEEEQFIQAVNYLKDAKNATEHSLADDVNIVWPLVKNHRYAAYVDSLRYDRYREADRRLEILRTITIEDPRRNMLRILSAMWSIRDSEGNRIGASLYTRHSSHAWTMPSMFEFFASLVTAEDPPPLKTNTRYRQTLHDQIAQLFFFSSLLK